MPKSRLCTNLKSASPPCPPASLDQTTRGDREMVLGNIRSRLLTLETIRPWEKNADIYSSTCANAAFTLMERKFAPPDDRLRSLVAREKQMPGLLAEARVNLKNPPRIFTEIAIEQLPGIISFFRARRARSPSPTPTIPRSKQNSRRPTPPSSPRSTTISNGSRPTCSPRSNGDFRIGADTFSKKLHYDEMVDIPLDKLLEIG